MSSRAPDAWSRDVSGSFAKNRTTITLSSIPELNQYNEYTKLVPYIVMHPTELGVEQWARFSLLKIRSSVVPIGMR